MTTECYAMVRGSTLRITELDKRGAVGPEVNHVVSKFASKISVDPVTESGSTEVLRDEDTDQIRLVLNRPEVTIRYGVQLDFIKVDPGLLNLISAVPVVRNALGDVVGFDARTRLPVSSFAMEVWSKLAGDTCARPAPVAEDFGMGPFGFIPYGGRPSGGYGVDSFGVSPFGPGELITAGEGTPYRRWGYVLFPWLKGGYLSGFTFSNGLVSFNLRGARTQRGPKWGHGPFDIDGVGSLLIDPVSRNTTWRTAVVGGTPPEPTCGVQTLADGFGWGDFGEGEGFGGLGA